MLPNKVTGTVSPYLLVTGMRPSIPEYYFGQTGIFYGKRKDSEMRGEWGIFLGYVGATNKYLRAYFLLRNGVYSRKNSSPIPAFQMNGICHRAYAPLMCPPPLSQYQCILRTRTTSKISIFKQDDHYGTYQYQMRRV